MTDCFDDGEDKVSTQWLGRFLQIGSPSIDIPEISALKLDPSFSVTRLNQDPRASAETIGSMRSIPDGLEEDSFDVVYSDNDITRYFWHERYSYMETGFKLTKEGGIFVCSCNDVSFILQYLEDGDLNDKLHYDDGKSISPIEILYGKPEIDGQTYDIYKLRNSVYNARALGELAISCGFSDAFVSRKNSAELVLVAQKGQRSLNLPEYLTRWLDEAFSEG